MNAYNETKQPKVGVILEGFNRSGGVRVVVGLLNKLVDDGCHVDVVLRDSWGGATYPIDSRVVIRSQDSKFKLIRWFKFYFISAFYLRNNYDVVVLTSFKTPVWFFVAKYLCGARSEGLYLLQHNELYAQISGVRNIFHRNLLRVIFCVGLRFVDNYVVVSRWISRSLRLKKFLKIPVGVSNELVRLSGELSRVDDGRLSIGFVLKVGQGKGYDEAVFLIKEIIRQHKNIEITIASQDSCRELLEIDGRVNVLHCKNDEEMSKFYKGTSIFVYTSTFEGFGLPPLEAMLFGAIVVSRKASGMREYLSERNAICVGRSSQDFYIAIDNAIVSYEFLATSGLRENARQTALKYSMDAFLHQLSRYIKSLSEIG